MQTKYLLIGIAILVVLVVLGVILVPRLMNSQQVASPTYWPTNSWQTNTPEQQGLDSGKLAKALQVIKDQDIAINSLLLIRNGYVVLDATFYNPYDGKYPHDLASVTKSVMTTLIGIAVGQGKLDLDQKVVSFFPELDIANMDSLKEKLTVRHLVSMTNGFESGCQADDLGTIYRMRAGSTDWVQSALDRKMVQEPGKSFCYDSPGMHLLSAILQKATKMTALEFAKQNLFGPLGIKEAIWETDLQGRTNGWGDLHLYPQDAAKLGFLFLNHGVWDGVQVVPAEWVKQATQPQITAGEDDYGYGWWITDTSYGARGREGQNVAVVPSLNAIVVSTGGGFEYDSIDPYISASVVDPANPLPANPQAVAQLQSVVNSFIQPLPSLPVTAQPASVEAISGKTYQIEPNAYGITALKINFSQPDQAFIYLTQLDSTMVLNVGLDDQYRQSPDGSLLRGYWKDAQTFNIEKFDVGLSDIQIDINDNKLQFDISGLTLFGTMENQ